MRYIFIALFICCPLLIPFTSCAQHGWDWGISNTGAGSVIPSSSAVDHEGNLYIAGQTYGGYASTTIDSIVFGTHTVYNYSGAVNQMIIAKVDTAGNYLWAIGSQGGTVNVAALATDPAGNVYVLGLTTAASISLGTVTVTNIYAPAEAAFIVKIAPNGTVLWGHTYLVSIDPFTPSGNGIGVDNAGNAYVIGNFHHSWQLQDGVTLSNHNAAATTEDIMLLKYGPDGVLKWAKDFGSDGDDYPFIQHNCSSDNSNNIINVTPAGNIYMSGVFISDSINLGSTTLYNPYAGSASCSTSSYICKLDSSGNPVWAKYVNKKTHIDEIITDAHENVFLAGVVDAVDSWGTFTLGSGALIAKMDAAGNLKWAVTSSGGAARTIAMDRAGNVMIAGFMYDSMYFNGNVLPWPGVTYPEFVAWYDTLGTYVSSMSVAEGGMFSSPMRADNFGGFYLTGAFFKGPLTFGPDVLDTAGIVMYNTYIARYIYASLPPALSVPNAMPAGNILLYPNPAGNNLIVKAGEQIQAINISDMLGKNVLSVSCNDKMVNIDIAGIPPGVYLIRVNKTFVQKFVKQ